MFVGKKTEGGEQHVVDGTNGEGFECFRCGRSKPSCDGARSCKHQKKADGSNANSKEKIEQMIKECKEAKKNRKLGGAQHMMDSNVVPSWTDALNEEDSHDGNLMVE